MADEIKTEKKVGQEVKAVFGKTLDLSSLEGFDINEILRLERDLMEVEKGDPNYVYGWMNTRDPACAIKLRKGLWELVTPDTDPDIISGAMYDEAHKEYRLNELVLVRMPKEKYQRLQAAYTARAAMRETAIQQAYKERIGGHGDVMTSESIREGSVHFDSKSGRYVEELSRK